MRRSWRAGWGGRASAAPRTSRSTWRSARCAWATASSPKATSSRSTGPRARSRSRTCRWSRPRWTRRSSGCWPGRTSCATCACAPTPTRRPTRRKAREFGAEGIGLCRTEHMFMAADRQPKMRAMIMARADDERRAALDELLPLQQTDFEGIFEAMEGLPVTIRLLDPPLHEFLPNIAEVSQELERARIEQADDLEELERTLRAGARRWRRSTRCWARAGRAWASCSRTSTGCRCARSSGRRGRCGSGRASGRRRDHGAAHRLRARARAAARRDREDRVRGGDDGGRGLLGRDDDRAAARVLRRRPDRHVRGLLLVRHERPHADGSRVLARRHRGEDPGPLHRHADPRPLAVRDDRRAGRRAAGADGRVAREGCAEGPAPRSLRRARRRSGLDRVLRRVRAWTTCRALPTASRWRGWPPRRRP